MSKNNVKMVQRKMADQKQKFGIRKLSVGVASVLLGTVFYMQGGTVHADVNSTMSVGNDTANVVNENSGISSSAVTLSISNSASSANSASAVVSANDVTNSIATSQVSTSSVDSAAGQVSNVVSAVSEQGSVVPTSQVNAGVDNVIVSDNTSVASSLASVQNSQVSASTENASNGQARSNSLLSLNRNSNVNTSFLVVSKVASTGTLNNAANGGFDEATWGKLDVNAWQGHVQGDYYQLMAYTGDANHVIVPNEADFAKAGISTSGKQVGVTSDLMHIIFRDKTTAQDATVAFSKTDNKQVKAINADWEDTWGHAYQYVNGSWIYSKGKLTKFDGSNLDVANITNMQYMFNGNQINDLSSLANWKVDNVTNIDGMFAENKISDLNPLANWKVNNVIYMGQMFEDNQIVDLSPISGWNVNNVTLMILMFDGNTGSQTKTTTAKRIINFIYPINYAGKKQDSVTQTVDVPQKVNIILTTKDSKPSNNILDWVTKTETPEAPDPVYFQDYTVPEIKGLLEPDKTVIAGQPADLTKPINVTVTYKLVESNTNDAFALDSKNGLHEHANVNDNGGYDTDFWGALDVSKFTTVKNGDNLEITGYTGDSSKVIIPNIADFELNNLDQGAKQVTISSWVMHNLAEKATRIGLSKTNNQKVVAGDAIWQDAFGGLTNEPNTYSNANGGIWIYNPNLTVMDLHNLDTTNITDMGSMFNGGRNLKVVGDLSQWNVANVVNMTAMFQEASLLTNIGDLDDWDTSKVTDMSGMFNNAFLLTNIGDLSKWNTSKVTDMDAMFQHDSDLTNIGNLSKWDTSNVTDMSYMFSKASKLQNLGDLSNWDTSKVTNMRAMFQSDLGLTNIGSLSKWDTSNVTDMSYMFSNASNLQSLGNLDDWNTSKVTDMSYMFNRVSKLQRLGDLSKWDTSKVTNMRAMFQSDLGLTNIGSLSKWDTSNVTDMAFMFNSVSNLQSLGNLDDWNVSNVTDMEAMFQDDSSLTNIGDLSKWNTFEVTNMSYMFNRASKLTNIGDLSKWDTSNVTDMGYMFNGASSLQDLGDLSKWDTSNVTNMSVMFNNTTNLKNIGDLSKWQTGNVRSMLGMFSDASSLQDLGDLSNWDTSNVTNMSYMFGGAVSLINVGDLSKWNTSKVTDMSYMFNDMAALKTLNISNWDLTDLLGWPQLSNIFTGNKNLVLIANDLKLPTWYIPVTDANNYFADHMAVITNNDNLLKSTGANDTITVDNTATTRPIFYQSNGSSDAVSVLKQADQDYIKQYQQVHPGYALNLATTLDQTKPLALANAEFTSSKIPQTFKINFVDDANGQIVASSSVEQALVDTTLTLDAKELTKLIPEHYYFTDANYSIPTSFNYQHVTDNLTIHLTKAPVYTFNLVDDTSNKTVSTFVWDGIDSNHHLTGTVSDLNQKIKQAVNAVEWKNVPAGSQHGAKSANLLTTVTDLTALPTQDTTQTVHFTHATHSINEAHDVNQVVHYVYQNGSKALDDHVDSVHFSRDGYHDEFDNTDHWNSWTPSLTYDFAAVQSPKIQGFTPDIQTVDKATVNPSSQNIEQTVTYNPDAQKAVVKYIDDTDQMQLSAEDFSGYSNGNSGYNTKSSIDKYLAEHYVLVSDDTHGQNVIYDHDDNNDQVYEVHLSHAIHPINEAHDVSQVVHYVYQNGSKAANDYTNQVHFVRDGYRDEVTNTDHWNFWTPSATYDFVAVPSPKIQGFTPDIQTVGQTTVTPSSQNIEQTVTYYGDVQLGHVKYIDDSDNGRVMSSDDLSGHTGETDSYTTSKNIKNYISQGYVFVSDNYPATGVVFDNNDLVDQYFEVHFKHGTTTVTPDQPGKPGEPINPGDPDGSKYPNGTDAQSLQVDVPRTIDYVYQNGQKAQASVNDSLHFIETKVIDKVTGKVLSDTWSPVQNFETKVTPTIDGYTPDRQSVSNTGINHDHPAIHEVVTYNPDAQKAVVKYIDDTDQKQLSAEDLTGRSDENSGYNTKSSIDKYIAGHYVLVSDDTHGQNVVYDHDDNINQVYEVHFKHGTETASESLVKNLIVHYVYADGVARSGQASEDQKAQSLTFKRTGTKDLVTNNIAWNAWDHANQTFDEIKSPIIDGYTPDQVSIKDVQVNADGLELTEKTVVYHADSQKLMVNFIDDVTGKTLETVNKVGQSDESANYDTKNDISKYIAQHYDLVSDDTKGGNLVFDHDDNVDQVYNVHLTHHTHQINDQVTKSEVIYYVYADGLARTGQAADDYHAKDLVFTRDGYRDEVTNEDHWNAWTPASQKFVSVKSPEIQGYTADQTEIPVIKMNSASDNIERTVTYNADKQKLDVVFIDDTLGKTLSTVTKEGLSDESASYNTKDDINHYKSLHYNVVSDGTQGQNLVFDHNDGKDQHYEVHLVHATHPIDEQKLIKQTIHYQLADGTKVFDDHTAQVDFSRDGYHDEVTNEDHWNPWTPSDTQTFSNVVSPVKPGYTPDKASVAVVDVHPGDKDIEETVIYSPDKQVMMINYIDDVTGKTLSTKQITGVSDASTNYNTKSSINSYVADHYKLVSDDTNGDNLVFDHDDSTDQVYNVHLTHTYQKVDDHKSVNETVHYVYNNGQIARSDYKAPAINFSRTGTKDLVTSNIVWNAWTPAEQSFVSVTTPAINGYTPDVEVVPSVNVNHESADVERTVIYHADDQTILVNYIDDDTYSTLKTDTVIGKTAQKSNYTTKKSIDGYIADHYKLVSDDTNDNELVFDSDSTKAQVYNVHLKHVHQNVSDSALVNETIHYAYADSSKASDDYHASAISFKRTGDKDLVTNAIVWDAWIPASQDFKAVDSPVIDGYTPSQKTISNITVKPGDKDVDQTVVYAPDAQSIVVNYIDDFTGKTLKTDMLTGKSDQASDYTTKNNINGYENQHYVLVSDGTQGKPLIFDHDDKAIQVYNVHLSHQTEPASQSRIIHETIDYAYANGSKAADTVTAKPLTFIQTGVKDLVTGNIDWNGTWTAKQTFAEVKSPEIIGYTASRTFVDPITVDHNSSDIHQTVIYTANDQTAKIKYVDDVTGKALETDSANGKFGDRINFSHAVDTQIKAFESQGYKFKSNSFNGQKYQADNSQNEFEVHFTHGTQNVSRNNKVTETVKYQFADGSQAQKDHVQTVEFTQHGVQDLVTKTTVWTPSDPQTFVSVDTPHITGYTADVQNIPAVTVNFGDANITKVVTYKANDQLAGIKYIDDTTGKTLDSQAASGKFGTKIEFMNDPAAMIQKFEGQGYKLVSDDFNGQAYQADNSKNQFEVHFKHGMKNVSRTSTITRTINYVDQKTGKEVHQPVIQTLTFTENGVTDLVTGKTTWDTPSDQQFVKVESPKIDGYENPDILVVDAETVKFGDGDQTVTVHYQKVEIPATSDTSKVPSDSSTPSAPTTQHESNISTMPMHTPTQVGSQNVSGQQISNNHGESQLPQTGNQDNHQAGLVGLVSVIFAGLLGLGKRRRKND